MTAPAGKPGSVPGFFLRMELADRKQPNFVTLEKVNSDGTVSQYAVFFEVEKDKNRKRRLALRIQSAYVLDVLERYVLVTGPYGE